jgi:mRNA-degrading endonuclease RelE of RelBE toxin-antitoxin system
MIIYISKAVDKASQKLYKKCNKIFDDIENFVNDLKKSSQAIGDKLQEFLSLPVYKARIKNTSANKGKNGGFKIIYYVFDKKNELNILALFSKNEKENISKEEIIQILKEKNLL